MARTYLQHVNKVLRRLNEVEVTEGDWAGLKGIHASVKDSVADAVQEINTHHRKWPFNASEFTQALTKGQVEYGWPLDFKDVDINSFVVSDLEQSYIIKPISRERWYRDYRIDSLNNATDGECRPEYVCRTHGNGYALARTPDTDDYTLVYRYFFTPDLLSAFDDEATIPDEYNHVIIYGALKHMYMFNDNVEQANMIEKEYFKPSLDAMRSILINDELLMEDTRINF